MPTRSLVRDDLQPLGGRHRHGGGAHDGSTAEHRHGLPPMVLLCQLAWFILRRPAAFFTTWKLDATLLTYTASLAVWLSLGIMTCRFVLMRSPKRASRAVAAASGPGDYGFSPGAWSRRAAILTNFTSGLLIVLFRPFRVGDDVQVGDELFTVQAIYRLLRHGHDLQECAHLAAKLDGTRDVEADHQLYRQYELYARAYSSRARRAAAVRRCPRRHECRR